MENKTVDILDIPFYRTTQERFIDELLRDAENEYRRFVVTANPEIVMSAKNDIEFKKSCSASRLYYC